MESLSSENRSLALDILYDIQSALEKIQERTKRIHHVDDFLGSADGMVLLDATCMLLIALGESLKNLDKVTNGELLPTYPTIPTDKRTKRHHFPSLLRCGCRPNIMDCQQRNSPTEKSY